MKNLIFTLFFILGLSFIVKADTWLLPTTEKYCSENKKYCLKVEPKKLESQLSYFQDKVDGKENAGADKSEKENFCKGTFSANGKKLWKVQLDNEVSPVSALVANDGSYVITFDNWHGVGYGDNAVAIYNGSTGSLIKKMSLTDFLTESDISNLPASTSSIHWHGTHQIDYEKKQLILKVVKPSKEKEFFDVRIDLKTGVVLDNIIDRIPSLQFLLHTKEVIQNESKYPVNQEIVACQPQGDFSEISVSELNKRIIFKELPEYPVAAKAVRAKGDSVFEIYISKNGEIECIKPISGHPLLRATLLNSIKKWKFESSQSNYTGKIIIEGNYMLVLNGKVIE